ncbi:MAG: aminotransferase class IV [Bacteroidales bacterium]|nr:aminotransferase class IV [Bacteroidales bacterium]
METALLSYYVVNDSLQSVCDFNPWPLEKGISVYEVIRVENGIPLFLKEHLDRFFQSALLESKRIPYDKKEVKLRLKALITENKFLFGNIKFLYHWPPEGSGQFLAWIVPFFYPSKEQYQQGVSVGIMSAERPNPNAKKALYALREKADHLMKEQKNYEVAYISTDGYITEGSRSNLFFISDGKIITPEVKMVLPGVTRARILELSKVRNIPVLEPKIHPGDMAGYQSCFLTATSMKVLPVSKLGAYHFSVINPLLMTLINDYDALCKENKKDFSWD